MYLTAVLDGEEAPNPDESIEEWQSRTGHRKPPEYPVEDVADIAWLDDYLREAFTDDFSPQQARMFANALFDATGTFRAESETEEEQLKAVVEAGRWVGYWANAQTAIESREQQEYHAENS